MKVAVIYTGMVRTMQDTISYFKKNILLTDNVHVFAVVQSDTPDETQNYLEKSLGNHLKSLLFFKNNNDEWITIRETLLTNMTLDDSWKHYLRTSGSMIEYYQLYLASRLISEYESLHNIRYNYVIRNRTDIIYTKPLDFSWLLLTEEIIEEKLANVDINNVAEKISATINFMNRLMGDRNFENGICRCFNYETDPLFNKIIFCDSHETMSKNLLYYILHGRYTLVLRDNLYYVMNRDYLEDLALLGITYGELKSDDDYWFNAEEQYRSVMKKNNITIFDSVTKVEVESLYNYDDKNYFDEQGNLLDNDTLFFIKRK